MGIWLLSFLKEDFGRGEGCGLCLAVVHGLIFGRCPVGTEVGALLIDVAENSVLEQQRFIIQQIERVRKGTSQEGKHIQMMISEFQ